MMTDPVADFLSRIRNAVSAKHAQVKVRSSKVSKALALILKQEGFIADCHELTGDDKYKMNVTLRYDFDGAPVISGLKRVSKPGLRVYKGASELPKVRNGNGLAIVSTPKGMMTADAAREHKHGGEVLCTVW